MRVLRGAAASRRGGGRCCSSRARCWATQQGAQRHAILSLPSLATRVSVSEMQTTYQARKNLVAYSQDCSKCRRALSRRAERSSALLSLLLHLRLLLELLPVPHLRNRQTASQQQHALPNESVGGAPAEVLSSTVRARQRPRWQAPGFVAVPQQCAVLVSMATEGEDCAPVTLMAGCGAHGRGDPQSSLPRWESTKAGPLLALLLGASPPPSSLCALFGKLFGVTRLFVVVSAEKRHRCLLFGSSAAFRCSSGNSQAHHKVLRQPHAAARTFL